MPVYESCKVWRYEDESNKGFTNHKLSFKYSAFSKEFSPCLKSRSIEVLKLELIRDAQSIEQLGGINL